MEKEVKKKRVSKKAKEQETQATAVEVAVVEDKPKKATRKPRAKKAEKPAVEPIVEGASVPETVEAVVEVAEEKTAQKETEQQAKKPRKPRTKKAKKTEAPLEKEQVQKAEEKPAEEKHELTRQEKKDAVKGVVKELLQGATMRRTKLIDEASKLYVERFPAEENANVNDVKGRVGSVITLMEQAKEIFLVRGEMTLEKPAEKGATVEEKAEEPVPAPVKEEHLPVPVPEAKLAPVFDLSAILGEKKVEKPAQKKAEEKAEDVPVKTEKKPVKKATEKTVRTATAKAKPQDKLKEKFLKKIRSHGGAYLEYYAVYLLQRYAQSNGRRLEGLRISGGENDGGIDGEIVLTDRLGFRETLYIQAKNWEPTDEKWMVGETLLQQFIGAVTYRLRKEGKGNGRGVYVTTSRFSDGAKKMLDDMSDSFVGYDGDELFELAKECRFGLVQKDGEWTLDENLLSGEKAFFNM